MTIHAIFYKQADFAAETLHSMLVQTYGNVEASAGLCTKSIWRRYKVRRQFSP